MSDAMSTHSLRILPRKEVTAGQLRSSVAYLDVNNATNVDKVG